MTRVIHTGDTHLGYQQYHSPTRRQDFLDAFERVIEDAIADDVSAVVHAGDLFHDRRPALPDLLGTLSVLRRLASAEIPFLAVVGNHESTRGGQWLDLFEQLGLATRLSAEPVVVDGVAFYGLDHVPTSKRADLDYAFDPHDADFSALVAHGLFTPFAHADWETETVLEESTVDFDAVLLGDNHAPGTEHVADTPVTYCGSTERVSTSERDGRGYNLVSFDEGRVDIRRRAVETRPFKFVEVTLGESEGEERVREQVRQHDLEDAVVVVEITGDGDPVTPANIETLATERGALVARVTDRREFEATEGSEATVDFADPDAAVRERVSELGLSPAALDVDDAVRGETADTNVRETVKRRVAERLDDGVSGFDPAPVDEDEHTEQTPALANGDGRTEVSDSDAKDAGERDGDANDTDEDNEAAERNDPSELASHDESSSAESAEATNNSETAEGSEDESSETDDADSETKPKSNRRAAAETASDGQVSMEDYL